MAGALEDLRGAALCARTPALQRRTLVDERLDDVQLVGVKFVVVLGVGDGRFENLGDIAADVTGGELEEDAGVLDALAADVVDDQARLARGRTDVASGGADELRRRCDLIGCGLLGCWLLGRGLGVVLLVGRLGLGSRLLCGSRLGARLLGRCFGGRLLLGSRLGGAFVGLGALQRGSWQPASSQRLASSQRRLLRG